MGIIFVLSDGWLIDVKINKVYCNLKSNVIYSNRNKGVDLQYVKEYQTEKDDVKLVRILLYGPVGAGKSSFVNSVSSVLRGKISLPAAANNSAESDKSYTKKVRKLLISLNYRPQK